jgi:hypothetical protein
MLDLLYYFGLLDTILTYIPYYMDFAPNLIGNWVNISLPLNFEPYIWSYNKEFAPNLIGNWVNNSLPLNIEPYIWSYNTSLDFSLVLANENKLNQNNEIFGWNIQYLPSQDWIYNTPLTHNSEFFNNLDRFKLEEKQSFQETWYTLYLRFLPQMHQKKSYRRILRYLCKLRGRYARRYLYYGFRPYSFPWFSIDLRLREKKNLWIINWK